MAIRLDHPAAHLTVAGGGGLDAGGVGNFGGGGTEVGGSGEGGLGLGGEGEGPGEGAGEGGGGRVGGAGLQQTRGPPGGPALVTGRRGQAVHPETSLKRLNCVHSVLAELQTPASSTTKRSPIARTHTPTSSCMTHLGGEGGGGEGGGGLRQSMQGIVQRNNTR